jgi:hypothetical protein
MNSILIPIICLCYQSECLRRVNNETRQSRTSICARMHAGRSSPPSPRVHGPPSLSTITRNQCSTQKGTTR